MKGFDQILHELEAGKISAQQAKDLTAKLINAARNSCDDNCHGNGWYNTGIDCVMIRLDMKGEMPCSA